MLFHDIAILQDAKLPVVHQYDRLPGAVVQFQHMYPCSWSC